MIDIPNNIHVEQAINRAIEMAIEHSHEFVTPEHLLCAFLEQDEFVSSLNKLMNESDGHLKFIVYIQTLVDVGY